jgi:TRAP-type C4-dicarboxylate transport system substrate-binding protein
MHRRPSRTRAFTLVAALAVALAASACAGSGVDKAGGTRTKQPVVLTLANHEDASEDVQFWIEEVQRRSGGSLRIQVTNRWRDQEADYDKGTIADVQAGKVQLAKVAARAYDTVGVTSFQALLAPLLIDNPTLEQRVLESDLAGQLLAGTGKLDLVGLAVLPTRLRKPLGLSRPLVGVEDYRGARIGVREGEVAKATFTALGATPVEYVPGGPLVGLDGIEADLGVIKGNEYDQQAKAVTANVTLWPKPVTVVINRKVFKSLTASQQDALRQAGSAAVWRQLDFLRGLTDEDRGILCRRGLRFMRASDRDLAALRRAVQPVYDTIARNPQTRSFLRRIQAMKHETAATPDAPTCSRSDTTTTTTTGAADQQATVLDGVYRTSFTREELAASPLLTDPSEASDENWGRFTLTLQHGRVTFTAQQTDVANFHTSGTYTLNGDAIVLRFTAGGSAGETFAFRWSLYRDVLTFKRDASLGVAPTPWLVKPWRRVG